MRAAIYRRIPAVLLPPIALLYVLGYILIGGGIIYGLFLLSPLFGWAAIGVLWARMLLRR